MGRLHGFGVAAVIALVAVPAIALAGSPSRPAAGLWVPYVPVEADGTTALATFTVGSGITSVTFDVGSQAESNSNCPTGSVSVPGPLELKRYKFPGGRPFWGFGRVVRSKAFPRGKYEDAPVTATLDGQPVKGATFGLDFAPAKTEGVKGDAGLGEFDFSAKCQVSLQEAISQAENSGNPGIAGT
jgi:hypothetical protein